MKSNKMAIAVMFMMYFIIGFVFMLTGPIGTIVKTQFGASNAMSQLGSSANFLAYLFVGIPAGIYMKRRGYNPTSRLAMTVGGVGIGVQILAGRIESFPIYVLGAFIAGLSLAMLNLIASSMLNTLGGGGKGGNRLLQFGCIVNSLGGMSAPIVLGQLLGGESPKVADAAPAQLIALGVFVLGLVTILCSRMPEPHLDTSDGSAGLASSFADMRKLLGYRHFVFGVIAFCLFIPVEAGIPNIAQLYLTQAGSPACLGSAVAGAMAASYCAAMMFGRFIAGMLSSRVSSRTMVAFAALICIVLLAVETNLPLIMVKLPLVTQALPLSMLVMVTCGLFTSCMLGCILNMAFEGLGSLVPYASGIASSLVCGGALLTPIGGIGDRFGILSCNYAFMAFLAYVVVFALFLSRPAQRNG